MSINLKPKGSSAALGKGSVSPLTSDQEIDEIVEGTLFQHKYASNQCYRDIANILFDNDHNEARAQQQDDIFSKLAKDSQQADGIEATDD